MKRTIIALLLILSVAACSKSSKLLGTWKLFDGSTLAFEKDNIAYLGQEGKTEREKSTYRMDGDTVFVTTEIIAQLQEKREFVLLLKDDKLEILQMKLFRGGDELMTTAEKLSQKIGVPKSQLVFSRMEEKK